MHLVNLTTARLKRISGLAIAVLFSAFSYAQENSPYSRFGMGDITPNRNIVNKSMGGISAGFSDFQSINLNNPASISSLAVTVFDVGGAIDIRTLKSNTSPERFKSTNTNISYLQLGFPIKQKKNLLWGVSFGLRPVTRINYKLLEPGRDPVTGDSLDFLSEGNGGLSQANISTGIRIKKFSFGISSGYSFGNNDYTRKKIFYNDSIIYQRSNSEVLTRFGGIFLTIGAQYEFRTARKGTIRLGAYTNLAQNLTAKRDALSETFRYDGNGGITTIDTVSYVKGNSGKIKYPATYSFGFTYSDSNYHWIIGADLDLADWKGYSSFGAKDANVQNNWTVRVGAQYMPADIRTPPSKYWKFVKYRAGLFYGKDYITLGADRPEYGATFGAGFPLTSLNSRNPYGGFATFNAGIDIGVRGNKSSQSIRENITRFSIGFTMNTRWFQKLKYD
ncbi:hypothetical protein [Ferruginibacter sp. HRS2-29]|uniref:hypothetical protein n=1 Tax=Ferruginibacter sp. HRS2-29 TaxID=2487334 RepID=UPI0020CC82CF|nr:hypothetical protein [Ferruginibacter sp. HRS2-29]